MIMISHKYMNPYQKPAYSVDLIQDCNVIVRLMNQSIDTWNHVLVIVLNNENDGPARLDFRKGRDSPITELSLP